MIGLFIPLVSGAQGYQGYPTSQGMAKRTFVGTIDSINSNEKSFVIRIGGTASFFQKFIAALFPSRGYIAPKYEVITDENTIFNKKTTRGVSEANFNDLIVGQRVQVKGTYERLLTADSQNNILGRITANYVFILSPAAATTTSSRTTTSSTTTTSTSTTATSTTMTFQCVPRCYTPGGTALGWAWSCLNPVTGVWQWRYSSAGNKPSLIMIDKFCKNCDAECLHQGTDKEGWYSSCTGKLIVKGCIPSFVKDVNKPKK